MPLSKRASILLAEDNPDLRAMFRDMLEFRGMFVRVAEDGDACLAAAEELTPDLIVLDIMMPRRSGIEAAVELRRRPATAATPIIALTALTGHEVTRRALEAGCDLILNKPILPGDLVRGVEYLLEESGHPSRRRAQAEEFASRERSTADELIRQGGEVIRELSSDVQEPSETELRQRMQGIQLVPVCTSCGRIRLKDGEWRAIPERLRTYFDQWTSTSHGLCPDCLAREYPTLGNRG
jgi:CheY-like chemotaxis protein